jgi:hypothetical protein
LDATNDPLTVTLPDETRKYVPGRKAVSAGIERAPLTTANLRSAENRRIGLVSH